MESRIQPRRFGPAPDLDPETFAVRRERFFDRIGDSIAVVPAAPELVRSRDTEVPYRQSSDFYYLTGFPEPEAVAVFTPGNDAERYVLFVRRKDEEREAWTGPRIGLERARDEFGADAVYPISELEGRLPELLRSRDRIIFPLASSDPLDAMVRGAILQGRRSRQRSGRGPSSIVDLESITGPMRLIKDTAELHRIRVAAEIAAAGHVAAMLRARPGTGEWEVQAELESTFRALGASNPAFLSIVGAGNNATILHYVANQRRVGEGELLLVDAGVDWGMYCSDITRTFPASGRFTSPQRDLYRVVLEAEEAGIAAARPDAPATGIHEACVEVLVRGMIDLGILSNIGLADAIESGVYKRFYRHQSSHWLGIDVHDAGPYTIDDQPVRLTPGIVLTVEPGIYIPSDCSDVPEPFRGIGIRIEDDVIVTETGNEVITRDAPVDRVAIEMLMGSAS